MSIPGDLVERVLALSEEERIELAHLLLEGVPTTEEMESGYHEAWQAELADRLREIRERKVASVPWEGIKARLLRDQDADRES